MSAPTAKDLEAAFWMKPENSQWLVQKDGRTVLSDDAPRRVRDSFELWEREYKW